MDSPVEVIQGIRDQFSVTRGGSSGRWFAVQYTKERGQMASVRSGNIPEAWAIVRSVSFTSREDAQAQLEQWMREEKAEALLRGESFS